MLKTFYHWLILPSFDSRDVKIFSKGRLELCSQLNHRKDFLYSQIMGLNIILYWEACSHKFPVGVLDFFLCTVLQNILDVILILNLWRAFFSRLQLSIWGFCSSVAQSVSWYVVRGSGYHRDASYRPDIFIPFSGVNHLLSTST